MKKDNNKLNKNGCCVRWFGIWCISPSPFVYMCSGYNGPLKCKFNGDLKKDFKDRILPTLKLYKRGEID